MKYPGVWEYSKHPGLPSPSFFVRLSNLVATLQKTVGRSPLEITQVCAYCVGNVQEEHLKARNEKGSIVEVPMEILPSSLAGIFIPIQIAVEVLGYFGFFTWWDDNSS